MTKQDKAHTELPWTELPWVVQEHGDGTGIVRQAKTNQMVAQAVFDDAAFIVTACNEHYENKALISVLCTALEAARPLVDEYQNEVATIDEVGKVELVIMAIDAALRKAGAG
jgi:hypothetical protein